MGASLTRRVAFPGGKRDESDLSDRFTALVRLPIVLLLLIATAAGEPGRDRP